MDDLSDKRSNVDQDIISAAEDESNEESKSDSDVSNDSRTELQSKSDEEKGSDAVSVANDPKDVIKKSITARKAGKKAKVLASSVAKRQTIRDKVLESIQALNERQGSSQQAILKYMKGCYTIEDEHRNAMLVKRYLKKGVNDGDLLQVKRSFELSAKIKKSFVDQAKAKDKATKPQEKKEATKNQLVKHMPKPKLSTKNSSVAKKAAATEMNARPKVNEASISKSAASEAVITATKQPTKSAVKKAANPKRAKPTKTLKAPKSIGILTLPLAKPTRKSVVKVAAKKKAVKTSLSVARPATAESLSDKENKSEIENELTTTSPPPTSVAIGKRVEPKTAGKTETSVAGKYKRQKL